MGTRAALYYQNAEGIWQEIYCHFDGNPKVVLPALAHHKVEDIVAHGEYRQITVEQLEHYPHDKPAREVRRPRIPEWADYAYLLTATGWQQIPDAARQDLAHVDALL